MKRSFILDFTLDQNKEKERKRRTTIEREKYSKIPYNGLRGFIVGTINLLYKLLYNNKFTGAFLKNTEKFIIFRRFD